MFLFIKQCMFLPFEKATVLLRGNSSPLVEPWSYLFNASGTKSKIRSHEHNYILEKDLAYVALIMTLRVFTCAMVSESSHSTNMSDCMRHIGKSIQHAVKYFRKNNHAWCQHEQLITVNIYVCLRFDDLQALLL